jgi:hypothetical protein
VFVTKLEAKKCGERLATPAAPTHQPTETVSVIGRKSKSTQCQFEWLAGKTVEKTAGSTHCPPMHPAPNHHFSSGWKFS